MKEKKVVFFRARVSPSDMRFIRECGSTPTELIRYAIYSLKRDVEQLSSFRDTNNICTNKKNRESKHQADNKADNPLAHEKVMDETSQEPQAALLD